MSKTCYWPNGSTAANQTVCASGSQSACCPIGNECTSNGLCYDFGYLKRGSCTDKTWESSACPKYCNKNDGGNNAGLQETTNDILPCGNYFLLYHFVCANQSSWGSYGTTCNADNVFQFADMSKLAVVNATGGTTKSTATTSGTSTTSGAQTSSTGNAQPATTSSSSDSGVSGGTIGAAVVAGIMGLLFMITLGMLIAERRKRNKQPVQMAELGGDGVQPVQYGDKKMIYGNRRSELGSHSPVHEIGG
ncbi:gb [Venturia nashicola]|uniref:Gb n=1 Tax=Venturia nashicola TaxID=86259 RepID=A0A4Z1P930_9PEZI|nr:gb [Venturia nashicola]TLD37858.1 gb [Venturia nashicola]